jgi:Cytochrome oxidase c assembly
MKRVPPVLNPTRDTYIDMSRSRLSVADVLHRGVVLSLVGVCIWGIGTGILVHRDTLRMGRGSRD